MINPPIHFGKLPYRSELSPEQILYEVQQLTIHKRWFRNPFADFSCPFEGTIGTDSFELVCFNRSNPDRTIPKIKATIATDDAGKTTVLIALEMSLGAQLLNLLLVGAASFLCLLTFTEHKYFFAVFALMLAGLRWLRRFPDQFYARQILDLLKQRLRLIPSDSVPD